MFSGNGVLLRFEQMDVHLDPSPKHKIVQLKGVQHLAGHSRLQRRAWVKKIRRLVLSFPIYIYEPSW